MKTVRRARVRACVPAAAVALAVVSALVMTSTLVPRADAAGFGDEIVPSGVLRSETRQPGSFSRVSFGGPFDVEIRQGTREAVTLKADDNVLPVIETTIEGSGPNSHLNVNIRKNVTMRSKPHVTVVVDMVRVDSIALGGIGDLVAKGLRTGKLTVTMGGIGNVDLAALDTDDLSLSLGGKGRVRIAGRADTMKLSLAGSGSCESTDLAANDVTVSIAGSGDAHVHAEKSLKVTIAGSGNVVYRGHATPSTTVFGSGTVTKG